MGCHHKSPSAVVNALSELVCGKGTMDSSSSWSPEGARQKPLGFCSSKHHLRFLSRTSLHMSPGVIMLHTTVVKSD
jgi:hypothetical protein